MKSSVFCDESRIARSYATLGVTVLMARTFVYQYLGEEELVVEPDPNEKIAIPEKGEIILRNGRVWRVVSVKFAEKFGWERDSLIPMEVRVSLASLRSSQPWNW